MQKAILFGFMLALAGCSSGPSDVSGVEVVTTSRIDPANCKWDKDYAGNSINPHDCDRERVQSRSVTVVRPGTT